MEILVKLGVTVLALIGLVLTCIGLPGNLIMFLSVVLLAWYDGFVNLTGSYLVFIFLLFLVGELWEFLVGFLGIKKEKISWLSVLIIALGTISFAIAGSFVLPVVGSIIGGFIGAFITAFLVEYFFSTSHERALRLGLLAAKNQMFAVVGKLVVGIILFILLLKEIFTI